MADAIQPDSIAVLMIRGRLEGMELEEHLRSLLSIPRVVALEATTKRPPRIVREAAPLRQAKRLKFPGQVAVLVLYHPAQYPLARALLDRHEGAELWYVEPGELTGGRRGELEELQEYDALARERAASTLPRAEAADGGPPSVADETLRERLRERGVISPYAFVPRDRRWRSSSSE